MDTRIFWLLGFCMLSSNLQALDVSGYGDVENRFFLHDASDPRQHSSYLSLGLEPEFYHAWNDGDDAWNFKPFLRLDEHDSERTHVDIRELNWLHLEDAWTLRVGVGKVFWGVTESVHLVDIVNQTDGVEGPDGEDKLGQPMINLTLEQDWGTLDFFLLPGFRERTFAGEQGRLRLSPRVDPDLAAYESGAGRRHIDQALRWSHTLGDVDLALSHFRGTSREPRLLPALDPSGSPLLAPFYDQINQTGVELLWVPGNWIWKLEAIRRSGQGDAYGALAAGFEYTRVGIFESRIDLGYLVEFLYDERGDAAPTPVQNDTFLGLRWVFNDAQSTEVLIGGIVDNDNQGRLGFIEASRRLGEHYKLTLDARFFSNLDSANPSSSLQQDDVLIASLARFF